MLSTHILPEVAQTCQRVVIINKGRVVAVDTPEGLTARLQGAETLYVQVDAAGADATEAFQGVPGVTRVEISGHRTGNAAVTGYEIESARGTDIRREIARTVAAAELLAKNDFEALGPLMAASHDSLRDDFEVSTPVLDALVERLVATPGVWGARLTGAGFGGCVIAVCELGTRIDGAWWVRPSAGARVVTDVGA